MGLAGYFGCCMHLWLAHVFAFTAMDCNGILRTGEMKRTLTIVEDPVWLRIVVKILFWAMFVLLAYAIDYFVRAKGESRKGFYKESAPSGQGHVGSGSLLPIFDLV